MQQAVRSYLAAGVAFAGVGALAASPVAPPMPDLKPVAQSAAVELSSLVNPVDEFAAVFSSAFQNTVALGQRVADNPAPILSQIVKNQLTSAAAVGKLIDTLGQGVGAALAEAPAQLKQAADYLAAGNVSGALTTLVNVALGPVVQGVVNAILFNPDVWADFQNALRQPIANALAVVDILNIPNIYNTLGPLLAPVQVISDVTDAFGAAGDNIVAGIKNGNVETVANAVLHLGPAVAQALLNGNPIAGAYSAGLLGPQGIIAGLLSLRDLVANAITPPAAKSALAEVAGSPTAAASFVTLDVAPQAKAIEASKVVPESAAAQAVSEASSSAVAPAKAVSVTKEAVTKEVTSEGTVVSTTEGTSEAAPAGDTAATGAGEVKDSPATVPGKTGTSASTKKASTAKDVRDSIRGAVKDAGKGLKNAVSGLGGKTAKPGKTAKSESSAKSGGASNGGSSSGGAD
jgi:hypothetical protein